VATCRVEGVRIKGIATAVPDSVVSNEDDARVFGEEDARRILKNTGVKRRHVTRNGLCASDLCLAAAERLLDDLGWERSSVDALVFVTQLPDYVTPASSCVLQHRLGLSSGCIAFDMNLGCSGFVYGLYTVGRFISGGGIRRALLLVGDTTSRTLAPRDRAVVPVFGDAGAAAALEADSSASAIDFVLGTDGSGAKNLMLPAGMLRNPRTEKTRELRVRDDGNERSDEHTYMNGAEVFAFTLNAVPPLIRDIKKARGWEEEDVEHYVFHQASEFVLKNLARASKIPKEKLAIDVEEWGNTSSASIPLTICSSLRSAYREGARRTILAGFGVGWSWGAAALELGPIVIPEVVIVPDEPPMYPLGRPAGEAAAV
jgi:3-oxoacyl-[acyl-carrier-protein] synthase III